MVDFTQFVSGWRGFLVGHRRVWHPHHKLSLLGDRGGHLVVHPGAHARQLRSGFGLIRSILDRGGRIWGFGTSRSGRAYPWGVSWSAWLAGQVSNSHFFRYRDPEIDLPDPRRRRRPRRWRHRWWSVRRHRGWPALGGRTTIKWASPAPGPDTLGWRRWSGRAAQARVRHRNARSKRVHPQGWTFGRVDPDRVRLCRRLLRRHNRTRMRVWTGLNPAPRVVWTDHHRFPSCLVIRGAAGRIGLLNEAAGAGLPTVYFASSSFTPWWTPHTVLWSPHPRATHGVARVVDRLWKATRAAQVVRVVWTRL